MSNRLEYKGFVGTIDYCTEDSIFHGTVISLPNVLIMYDGKSLESLEEDFRRAIDFYLLPSDEAKRSYEVALQAQ